MTTLRNISKTSFLRSTLGISLMLGLGSVSALVGCGAEAVSEGEIDPTTVLMPSSDGKDSTLSAIGIDSEKRGASGNVNYLAGRIPLENGTDDELRSLVLTKLAATYELTSGTDLKVIDSQTDKNGNRFVRMQQIVDGVAVAHGHIVAAVANDGTVRAILGELLPRARVSAASGDGSAAVRSALSGIAGIANLTIHQGPTAAVFTNARGEATAAWRSIVEYDSAAGHSLEEVFVEQQSNALLANYTQIHSALNRQIYNMNQACISTGKNLPGTAMFSEGGSSSDSAAMGAYNGTGITYWFYKNFFNRDSYDNKGSKLTSSVHATFSGGTTCDPNNAVWMGYPYNQMGYGDGDGQILKNLANAVDVTGHELTHAVTGTTSQLVYQDESGALNEAMSDIHGVSVVAWQRGGGSSAGNPASFTVDSSTWMVGAAAAGPQLGGPALRYMNDPTRDGYSKDYYPERIPAGGTDNGGVHGNSGIANLAFYLLSVGGTHPRQKTTTVVTGIGMDKAVRIFYTANTSILTANSDFQAARNATAQAAQSLYGACSPEWQNTERAWDAVGVPGSWTSCTGGSPNPPPTTSTVAEVEPNDSPSTAMAISKSGTIVSGSFSTSQDTDYFKLTLAAGASLTAHLNVPAGADYDLYIYNSNGTLIGKSENGLGIADEVKVTNTGTAAFTRYVRVVYYSGTVGASAPYQLTLTY